MKRLVLGLLCAGLISVPSWAGAGLITVESNHTVEVTLDRLTKIMTSKGITIFARIDHSAGAEKIGVKLAPTQVLIFGNPKLGTPLMQSNREIAIDLPLKVLAWRDEAGKVWVSYNDPIYLKARHNISDKDPVFKKITGALAKLVGKAVSR